MELNDRKSGLAYLTQCADRNGNHWSEGRVWSDGDCPTCKGTNDAGHLSVPCSRYGRTSRECAPVAWRLAYVIAKTSGESLTVDSLDHAMGMVVNEHEDVAYIIRTYGGYKYV